jgi:glycine dehydrogenase subunit 2
MVASGRSRASKPTPRFKVLPGCATTLPTRFLMPNCLHVRLCDLYPVPFDRPNMHEFVCRSDRGEDGMTVSASDVCKRLIDYGIHPPASYFPLVVPHALMIEPTETETPDAFSAAQQEIEREARENPKMPRRALHDTPVRRLDEVRATRMRILRERPRTRSSACDASS